MNNHKIQRKDIKSFLVICAFRRVMHISLASPVWA